MLSENVYPFGLDTSDIILVTTGTLDMNVSRVDIENNTVVTIRINYIGGNGSFKIKVAPSVFFDENQNMLPVEYLTDYVTY